MYVLLYNIVCHHYPEQCGAHARVPYIILYTCSTCTLHELCMSVCLYCALPSVTNNTYLCHTCVHVLYICSACIYTLHFALHVCLYYGIATKSVTDITSFLSHLVFRTCKCTLHVLLCMCVLPHASHAHTHSTLHNNQQARTDTQSEV